MAGLKQQLGAEREASLQLQQRLQQQLQGEAALERQRHELALVTHRSATEAAERRAAAAEAEAEDTKRQLAEAARVRSELEAILKRMARPSSGVATAAPHARVQNQGCAA